MVSSTVKTCPALAVPFYGIAICKNTDLNLFYDYSPRNSSFLKFFDNEDKRLTEPMPIDTDCAFKCGHGFHLIGSSSRNCLPLSKWDGLQTVCKQILCPPLPNIPFAVYEPADCTGSKSSLGTNCTIICMEGFELKGPSFKVCNGKRNGVWSNKNKHPKCIDVQPPNIKCPIDYKIPMGANESWAVIMELESPTVSDNSNKDVSITFTPSISQNGTILLRGIHNFTYYAVDSFKNQASCNFSVTVIDNSPPVWDGCVDPSVVKIYPSMRVVDWEEPTAYDNSNDSVLIMSTLKPGGELNPGVYVANYTAIDSSNNTNVCILNITVEGKSIKLVEEVQELLNSFICRIQVSPIAIPAEWSECLCV